MEIVETSCGTGWATLSWMMAIEVVVESTLHWRHENVRCQCFVDNRNPLMWFYCEQTATDDLKHTVMINTMIPLSHVTPVVVVSLCTERWHHDMLCTVWWGRLMPICVYVHVIPFVCMFTCAHLCVCSCLSICVYLVCACVLICVCACVLICVCVPIILYVHVCPFCICAFVCMCPFVYVCLV